MNSFNSSPIQNRRTIQCGSAGSQTGGAAARQNSNRCMNRQNIARSYAAGQNSMSSRQNVSDGQNDAAQSNRICPTSAMGKAQLLDYIDQVSFAVDEVLLYLDTHPCDREAMEYFREQSKNRNMALKEYAKRFGPLTIDTAILCEAENWEWISQPWPWEGGCN